jgi:uncharacterized membrane protein (DUF373 family)
MRQPLLERWKALRVEWPTLTLYQRFEITVAFALTLIVSMVIFVALYRLTVGVVKGLVLGILDPLAHSVFQSVFGEIVTLLIALEFNHTLQYVVNRTQSVIQTKIVLLIALLAVARKVIILDLKEMGVGPTLGLAAIILVLGLTYWLIREQDDRLPDAKSAGMATGDQRHAHDLAPLAQMRIESGASESSTTT